MSGPNPGRPLRPPAHGDQATGEPVGAKVEFLCRLGRLAQRRSTAITERLQPAGGSPISDSSSKARRRQARGARGARIRSWLVLSQLNIERSPLRHVQSGAGNPLAGAVHRRFAGLDSARNFSRKVRPG